MTTIAQIYATLILKGIKTIDDVPEQLKMDVLTILSQSN